MVTSTPCRFAVLSTFSGCGGSSLGYQLAGGKVLLAVEHDSNAIATYRLNFPDTPIHEGDIEKLSVEDCLRLTKLSPGELDILDGSPPCQGFSTAGKRDFRDSRNQLFYQYIRLLRGLRPKAFVMENVSGMVKGKMRIVFAECLKEMKVSGYRVRARLLNAMYYDVPQSRERLIFIGIRDDLHVEPSHPRAQGIPKTVRQAIGDLPYNQAPEMQHVWIDEWERGTKWISHVPYVKSGGHLRCTSQYTRLHWDRPSFTLTRSGLPGMPYYVRNSHIHPSYHRALSVREMARLSSFPDDFMFVDALNNANGRIGNSVPPNMMKAIAEHVAGLIGRSQAGEGGSIPTPTLQTRRRNIATPPPR